MERPETDRTLAELAALRREIAELRAEQRLLAERVEEVARSFRAIATQIGIAAEPYRKGKSGEAKGRELPGFA
jgi:hypothetical protein